VALTNLAAELNGVVLKLAGAEAAFLELPDVRISEVGFDLGDRKAGIGKLKVAGGRARLAVDENGGLNLERIVKASGAPLAAAPVPRRPQARPRSHGGSIWPPST
jgi:hypothetical protein